MELDFLAGRLPLTIFKSLNDWQTVSIGNRMNRNQSYPKLIYLEVRLRSDLVDYCRLVYVWLRNVSGTDIFFGNLSVTVCETLNGRKYDIFEKLREIERTDLVQFILHNVDREVSSNPIF